MSQFRPYFANSHLSTLAGNFWKRAIDEARFPTQAVEYATAPGTTVVVHQNSPAGEVAGNILMLHGLQGSSASGYMVGMAAAALDAGYRVHRLNMRGCGGTEHLTNTLYNAGLTEDVHFLVRQLPRPLFVIGYSLGGNVMLKLAGELGAEAQQWLDGVCAVSTPIDLYACVLKMMRLENRLYEWRFVHSLRASYKRRHASNPARFPIEVLKGAWTVFDFDDRVTAPHFGFGDAVNYYRTQSALRFLGQIRVPTLVIQAENDPLIPFDLFQSPALRQNPAIQFLPVPHGGHLGFIARRQPRFWLDPVVLEWIARRAAPGTNRQFASSV